MRLGGVGCGSAAVAEMTMAQVQVRCSTRGGYQRVRPNAKPSATWCDNVVVCPVPLWAVEMVGRA